MSADRAAAADSDTPAAEQPPEIAVRNSTQDPTQDPTQSPNTAPITAPKQPLNPEPQQRWLIADPHPAEAEELAHAAGLPVLLAELLLARGVTSANEAFAFIHPEFSHLHDPLQMLGMDAAVARLTKAIALREPILLYGDYDVDGTMAVVLLKTAIEMLGGEARFHVPHRINEGYGLQSSVIEAAHASGVRLIITVDTGMRAFAEAETARRLDLDLIITDHHLLQAGNAVPPALAILNPNQPGCPYPEKSLCGAAIALKLAQALLSQRDPERTLRKTLPSFLKLAAIATIADAVPLRGENRTIAALGLKELRNPVAVGLKALFSVARIDPSAHELTGMDVGFRLGPRINAAGRMDVASEVVELFTTRDPVRATQLAAKMERMNSERRNTEAVALRQIEQRLTQDASLTADPLLLIDGQDWHRGVIGILASRVVERTAKPSIVVSLHDGVAHGSGRSVDGFHLLNAIESCADLFTRFGGHAFAVGFSLPADSMPALRSRLAAYAHEHLGARIPEHRLLIHAQLPLDRITPVLAGWLRKLEPTGHGNQEPIFVARQVRIAGPVRTINERHIALSLTQGQLRAEPIRAMGWGMAEKARRLHLQEGTMLDVAYRICENTHPEFGGLELVLKGFEPVESSL